MKKVNIFMTMLVMLMGVLTTKAQTTVSIYDTYNKQDISDWDVAGLNGGALNDNATDGYFTFILNNPVQTHTDGTTTLEQSFDLSSLDSIDIDFDLSYGQSSITTGAYDYTFEILVSNNNGTTYTSIETFDVLGTTDISGTNGSPTNGSITITDMSLLTVDSKVKLEIYITSTSGVSENSLVELDDVEITGYEDDGSVGINENVLSDDLEIYSYNKSVFLTSNENVNASVTVYNMSGQAVSNENVNISNFKTELNLNHLDSGMYIVTVNNETLTKSKNVLID